MPHAVAAVLSATNSHLIIAMCVHQVGRVAFQLQAAMDGLRVVVCSVAEQQPLVEYVSSRHTCSLSRYHSIAQQHQLDNCCQDALPAPTCAELVEHQHLEAGLRPALDEEQGALYVLALLQKQEQHG
jgi:hypothetical protein